MKQFIRLSDGQWPVTEMDLDPLCTAPSPNFKPNETEYVEPNQSTRPEVNTVIQRVIEIQPALVDGIWTQQWEAVNIYATDEEASAASIAAASIAAQASIAAAAATVETLRNTVILATQANLDNFAKARNYDSILSACSYTSSSVAKFAAEGSAAVIARDQTWSALYEVFEEVLAGTLPMPTSFAEVEHRLPKLIWTV